MHPYKLIEQGIYHPTILANNNLPQASSRSQMLWFFSVNYVINSAVQPYVEYILENTIKRYLQFPRFLNTEMEPVIEIHWERQDLFTLHGLTLIPTRISNYIHYDMWDEITYPSLNFNGCTVEV